MPQEVDLPVFEESTIRAAQCSSEGCTWSLRDSSMAPQKGAWVSAARAEGCGASRINKRTFEVMLIEEFLLQGHLGFKAYYANVFAIQGQRTNQHRASFSFSTNILRGPSTYSGRQARCGSLRAQPSLPWKWSQRECRRETPSNW